MRLTMTDVPLHARAKLAAYEAGVAYRRLTVGKTIPVADAKRVCHGTVVYRQHHLSVYCDELGSASWDIWGDAGHAFVRATLAGLTLDQCREVCAADAHLVANPIPAGLAAAGSGVMLEDALGAYDAHVRARSDRDRMGAGIAAYAPNHPVRTLLLGVAAGRPVWVGATDGTISAVPLSGDDLLRYAAARSAWRSWRPGGNLDPAAYLDFCDRYAAPGVPRP